MKITNLRQTCTACPSQWEARTEDGRPVYVRYRWGWISVSVGKDPGGDVRNAIDGDEIYSDQIGDEFDGTIEWPKVSELTGLTEVAARLEELDGLESAIRDEYADPDGFRRYQPIRTEPLSEATKAALRVVIDRIKLSVDPP